MNGYKVGIEAQSFQIEAGATQSWHRWRSDCGKAEIEKAAKEEEIKDYGETWNSEERRRKGY